MPLVTSGVDHGNLRELALSRMRDFGSLCRDIRTREVGIQEIHHKILPFEVKFRKGNHFVHTVCDQHVVGYRNLRSVNAAYYRYSCIRNHRTF